MERMRVEAPRGTAATRRAVSDMVCRLLGDETKRTPLKKGVPL